MIKQGSGEERQFLLFTQPNMEDVVIIFMEGPPPELWIMSDMALIMQIK
jgi:hypothetical protein